MRVLVTANQVPFIRGGAELLAENLLKALRSAGHQTELVRLPFKFSPDSDIQRLMDFCEGYDVATPNGQSIDRLISLQFPGYGMRHPQHVAWILHQHRAVYELYNSSTARPELQALRDAITDYDTRNLRQIECLYTISNRVAERIRQFNGLTAKPLYHPPPNADKLACNDQWGYVFAPSRLEALKRQDLLIEAARWVKSPTKILIGGVGGQQNRYAGLIEQYGLGDRVRLIGAFSEAEAIAFYGHALAVAFVPFDEDLGYVTLEAMYAAKPVITCRDSGGPLEFVKDRETGLICDPDPQALADAIDQLAGNPSRAAEMGKAGLDRVNLLNLSWDRVVETLCR